MDLQAGLSMLGGLSPQRFMRTHWQKRPLLVRQALPGLRAPVGRAELFGLAALDDVESRLVQRDGTAWTVRHGPLPRRALPPVSRPGWTLLVQGVDLHRDAARALLDRFGFVPAARLDDLMISWASDGGGVGPHVDAYDVFLLQVQGRRRWRIGRVDDDTYIEGLPLRILRRFEPEQQWLLEPGDLLYLPPGWGHDGVAEGECMTCSVGFRAPAAAELSSELLQRLADGEGSPRRYRDAGQPWTPEVARIPPSLATFACEAVLRRAREPGAIGRVLGESLTDPKPSVWFERSSGEVPLDRGVRLDRRSRMLYDDRHLYFNGESFRVGGRDGRLLRQLADRRALDGPACAKLSQAAVGHVTEWLALGWLVSGGTS